MNGGSVSENIFFIVVDLDAEHDPLLESVKAPALRKMLAALIADRGILRQSLCLVPEGCRDLLSGQPKTLEAGSPLLDSSHGPHSAQRS